jgi:hypothetical protein
MGQAGAFGADSRTPLNNPSSFDLKASMEITYEALTIFLLLIPGFLSSAILNAIVVRKRSEGFSAIIEALVFTFLIYVVVALVYNRAPVSVTITETSDGKNYALNLMPGVLALTFALSVSIPLLLGVLVTHDLHMKVLRAIKITHKTARENAWLDVFIDNNRFVIVNLSDGRRVSGWPMYYSDDPSERMLYLKDPAWVVDKDGKSDYIDMDIDGIFLVKQDLIMSIEFTNTSIKNVRLKKEEKP